jgi:hypothetical protein
MSLWYLAIFIEFLPSFQCSYPPAVDRPIAQQPNPEKQFDQE